MKATKAAGLLIGLAIVLALASIAGADCGDQCDFGDDSCSCTANGDTASYVEIGVIANDLSGSQDSYEQQGLYPVDWMTSGRLHWPGGDYARERFEVRWDDISSDNGRAWGRLSIWPATLEFDGYIRDNYAWNLYSDRDLQRQETTYDDLKLRFHKGELDNMSLRYESREFNRDGTAPLYSYGYDRLDYKYNFNLGGDEVRGSFRQVATATDTPRTGAAGEIDSSILKVDAKLSDEVSLYGKGTYTAYDFDNLADATFDSSDYTVGLSYRPDCDWTINADYRTKDNPDANTVSSHVSGLDAYGAKVTYLPGCGNRIEVGYQHRNVDYLQLNMQDPAISSLIRGIAQVTPHDVAAATTALSPEQDEVWTSFHWSVTDRLTTDTRVSFTDGDMPGTDLVAVNSNSLFFDQRLKRSSNWYYDVNGNDQLALLYSASESSNSARGADFDMQHVEGSWSRCTGGDGYVTFAVSNTDTTLDSLSAGTGYTTDDTTYVAGYTDSCECFDFGLDLALTDGRGSEDYEQLAAGADLNIKRFGPVDLRFDWFDRSDSNYTVFDTEAFEVSMTYRIDF
jgi:hypothetical protein